MEAAQMIPNPPTLIVEPAARKPKGRRKKWTQPGHLYFKGELHTFHCKAEMVAYIASMRNGK